LIENKVKISPFTLATNLTENKYYITSFLLATKQTHPYWQPMWVATMVW